MEINTYDQALAFIHGRPRFKKLPTLERMRAFLAALGHPEAGQTYLHVTGTNGKGSVVAMASQMLQESGLTVATFTSPFITRFNERIAINGQPISDTDLTTYTRQLAPVVAQMDAERPEGGPTEFEIDLAIAMLYFQAQTPDVVILEVGIGGKWDSTNVITPVVSTIVTVGLDHMRLLGPDLTAIAKQKAGIIKPGRPVVVGALPAAAQTVVAETATAQASPLLTLGEDFTVATAASPDLFKQVRYRDQLGLGFTARLGLAGDYQVANAGVAIATVATFLRATGRSPQPDKLAAGLAATRWPGRMEVVAREPLTILDGAHNLPGIQALVKTVQNELADRHVHLLVGILADKQVEQMVESLADLPQVHLTLTRFAGPSTNRPSAAIEDFLPAGLRERVNVVDDWHRALEHLQATVAAEDVILVTGSLYFVAEVRQFLKK